MKSNATRYSHDLTGVKPRAEVTVTGVDGRAYANVNLAGYTLGVLDNQPEGGHVQVAIKMAAYHAARCALQTLVGLALCVPDVVRRVIGDWVTNVDGDALPVNRLVLMLNPATASKTVDGHCTLCLQDAVSDPGPHGGWVHVGSASHAGGGTFAAGLPTVGQQEEVVHDAIEMLRQQGYTVTRDDE